VAIELCTALFSWQCVCQTVEDACVPGPWVSFGAGLTGPHVTHPGLVPKVAHLGALAILTLFLVCATEGQEISDLFWSGLGKVWQFPHELDGLSGGHQPDVVHIHQGVDERLETRPVVRLREPSRVVEQAEGGAVGYIVPLEVLHQQLVNIVSS